MTQVKNVDSINKVKNVVAYVRVSTDNQAKEDKFGIDEQKEIIMDYCSKNNMQISEWYIDNISGAVEVRPQFDEILYGTTKESAVTNPPVESVVVAKSDRIARDIKLYFYYMMLLEKKNISLISATEEVVNDDTGLGNVYKSLMLFVAEQERKNITKRTSGGRRQKAKKGGYSGGAVPFGYKVVDGNMVVDENQREHIITIFEMREKDGATMQQITNEMNELGVLSNRGKKFNTSTVQTILNNRRTYEGMYKYGDSGWVEGQHEAILEPLED